ncbi:DMT family transporter [Paracraurococcus lichenis]|uniref:DMT family transporter n=1 Tax=Paracraurococcus lichenis TaxID=3064888 RepID=A0ABT9E3D6_9PROT|nr:DMT family transporter [Paracraurococcus sp. LOR1-02]MDO9710662.1 DMT family transporter [Paracraurococcus sp. LOR1-02]
MSRLTTRQALTPWDVAALRFGGAFLVALPLVAWRGLPRIAPRRWPAITLFAGFGFPLLAYAGYRMAPAAHGAVVTAAGLPVATALLALALGLGRIGPWKAASLLLVVAGSLLLGVATSGPHPDAWRGDLLFLAAVCAWAVYTLMVQSWRLPALDATLVIALSAAPAYLPVWWLALPSAIGQVPWPVVLTQGLFHGAAAAVLAGLLYTQAVASIGPGPTTMIGAAVPALAALLAWPLLGEAMTPASFAAVGLVCAGLALSVLRPDRVSG